MQLTGRFGRAGRRVNDRRRAWLSRWIEPHADPGSARLRDGRLAGVLCLGASLYTLAITPDLGSHLVGGLALAALLGTAAVAMFVIPWRRLPDGTLAIPLSIGLAALSLTGSTLFGELSHFEPLYVLAFGYSGMAFPPGWTARMAILALLCLVLAIWLGNQEDLIVEQVGMIAIGGMVGELVAGAVQVQRRHHRDLVRLQVGLSGLLAAEREDQAAELISRLAADLLQADGVLVTLRERPGSTLLVGRGGQGLGSQFAGVRSDYSIEQSGSKAAIANRKAYFIADAPNSPLVSERLRAALSATSILFLPILGQDEVLGVISIWWSSKIDELDPFGEQVVRLLSLQAGPVLDRVRQLQVLDQAALTDPLTGAGNRRAYEDRLEHLVDGTVLILCDLDRFKLVNDTQGHAAGDRVLRAFAAIAASCVRDGDLVARIGGDEFALLLPGGPVEADSVLTRLYLAWTAPAGVGFSAGSATRRAGEDGQHLSERADQALYAAKRRSRLAAGTG